MALMPLLHCPPLAGKEPALVYSRTALQDCSALVLTPAQQQQTAKFIHYWRRANVSRYNRYRDADSLPARYVLLILQHKLPASVQQAMLQQAITLAQHAAAVVLVCHDQHKTVRLAPAPLLQFCQAQTHHATMLANAHSVVTADSWLGFEALLWGKPVYSFLPSFYSALTLYCGNIALNKTISKQAPELAQWVWQLFYRQAQSVNLDNNGQPYHDMTDAINWLALQRSTRARFAPVLYAIGFNYHWRGTVQRFLQGSKLVFVNTPDKVPPHAQALIWGRRDISAQLAEGVGLLRLEDGFLRSVGLGMQFAQPLSWVVDSRGLYFDAGTSSDLELLLEQHPLSDELQQQAAALISQLVAYGVSKYNTGKQDWQAPPTPQRKILVAGQVESDASIAYGCSGIRTNLELLKTVRQANPDAFIIYKPHPDVIAKARAQGKGEQQAAQFCDLLLENVNIACVMAAVDEVHVLTSLAGFEALLRGKTVHCYGLPFYAGWGLTTDHCYTARRTRTLTLTQLVAATLLLYPLYISRSSGYYCSAGQTLAQLCQWREQGISLRQRLGVQLRKVINSIVGAK